MVGRPAARRIAYPAAAICATVAADMTLAAKDEPAAPDTRPKGGVRRLAPWAKAGVSVVLLWLLFLHYDLDAALGRLAAIDPFYLALAVTGGFVAFGITAWRWWFILKAQGYDVPLGTATGLTWIGLFFNQTLPSNVGGDVVRVWRLSRAGVPMGSVISSVLVDRVAALFALALIVLAGLPAVQQSADRAILAVLAGTVGLVLIGLALLFRLDRVAGLLRRFMPGGARAGLEKLSADSRHLLLPLGNGGPIVGISLVNHFVSVVLILMLAWGLGIDAGLGDFMVLIPPVVLATMLPLSFAGWGVREGASVALLATIGVSPAAALALSVAYGLVLLLSSLPGGVIWLVTGNRRKA